ncbi:MAG TPA: putative lipid II flippase FtsW [Ktedonobacteraceae bacterium]|nr:putative lipid II flippase FtsW [Ktedonobacteraceae bacterium]
MTRDVRRQPNKERQQRSLVHGPSGSYVRSPALRSAEERRGSVAQGKKSQGSKTSKSNTRFAFEEKLINPGVPLKRLPRLNPNSVRQDSGVVKSLKQQHSGLTADWRTQTASYGAERQETKKRAATVQAITEEEQEKLATLEMRLPRVAGKVDAWLLIIVLTLLCIGIVNVYSASSFQAARDQGDASYYFQRELMWAILGIVAMLLTLRVDYRQWRRFSLVGMLIILPLLVIVLKFGVNVYGASRWLSLGSFFSFEPSELTKLVLALYIADWLARKGDQVGTFLYGLVPFIILVGIVLGLVLLENDLGTAIIIAGFATAMFFTAGANITQFLLAMACGGLIFLKEAFSSYRFYRIAGFVNPFKDVTGINLQLYQALLALGSGGWFGLGLGNSRQKTGYLPFPYTDSIFPIIGEELGFVGCAVIVLLFLFLAFRGFRLARRTPDLYGALLATGITTWLVLQAMINIGANTGTIPYTGVPLPFISFGGSSLVVSLAAVGVLLNISRYIQEPEAPALSLRKKRVGSRFITTTQ